MYGDDYIVAASLYFVSIVWGIVKAIAWEDVKGHDSRKGISVLILLLGVGLFVGSLLWIRHRENATGVDRRNAKKTFVSITNPLPPRFFRDPHLVGLLMPMSIRNAGPFPADKEAYLDQLYLEPNISAESEQDAVSQFKAYKAIMDKRVPKDLPTLEPGQRFEFSTATFLPHDYVPENVFGKQTMYEVVSFRFYDDYGYYHETHFCQGVFTNDPTGQGQFSRSPCWRFNDQF